MEENEVRKNAEDMIYLTVCAIKGEKPEKSRIDGLELPKLFEVCQEHILTACVAYALESADIRDRDFTQAKEKAIRKNILLDAERGKILHSLEAEKIWYMPLKGSLLHKWYPKLGMRQMSDNDILCDGTKMEQVREVMLGYGYECKHFGMGTDDAYFKEPVMNFEMHRSLFKSSHIGKLYEYFKDVKERLIRDDDNEYGYHFRNEDFYIYVTAHEYRHFTSGGTGVRSLVDTYIFLGKFNDSLDWEYIDAELEKLGIADYERTSRQLAMKLFSSEELTSKDKDMLEYYIMSGVYGSHDNVIKNSIKYRTDNSKSKYLMYRLFPPVSFLRESVPWVRKSKLLIPAAYIYRLFRSLTVSRKKIKDETSELIK